MERDDSAIQQLLYNAAALEVECANEKLRPSFLYRPSICIDGNKWMALYGENQQDGVAGFGDSPDLAYRAFDKAWYEKLPTQASTGEKKDE